VLDEAQMALRRENRAIFFFVVVRVRPRERPARRASRCDGVLHGRENESVMLDRDIHVTLAKNR